MIRFYVSLYLLFQSAYLDSFCKTTKFAAPLQSPKKETRDSPFASPWEGTGPKRLSFLGFRMCPLQIVDKSKRCCNATQVFFSNLAVKYC